MLFTYKAQTNTGEIVEGKMEAKDKFELSRLLKASGQIAVFAKEVSIKKSLSFGGFSFLNIFSSKISLHEKINFTKNLSGMISAGLSLARALTVLEKQSDNKTFKNILSDLLKTVNDGGSLSQGMEKFPSVFTPIFISMTRAGEESGGMSGSLMEINKNLTKSYELNRKIKGAMMYPTVVLTAMILIGILMFMFVVPTLTKTFLDLGAELPFATRVIIFISDFISGHPILLFGIIFALIGLFILLLKQTFFKNFVDSILPRIPVIGPMIKEVESARMTRTLSSLLIAGVSMTKSLSIVREVVQNSLYKKALLKVSESIEKGIPMSVVIKENTNLYPVMVGEMIEVGEETGKLSDMLIDIAVFYEGEVDAKTKNLSGIVEPVLMIVIGSAVGFFAIAMITPMYSLLDSI